jgi:hypothetical protein
LAVDDRRSEPGPVSGRGLTIAAALAALTAGAALLATAGSSTPPPLPVAGVGVRFPPSLLGLLARSGGPGAVPLGRPWLDAEASLGPTRAFAFAAYRAPAGRCMVGYTARLETLAPEHATGTVSCQPARSQLLPNTLSITPAELAGPLVLWGSVPAAADRLALTTDAGRRLWFRLPGVRVHTAPELQAVVFNLAPLGPESVIRADAVRGARVLQSTSFLP